MTASGGRLSPWSDQGERSGNKPVGLHMNTERGLEQVHDPQQPTLATDAPA